MVQFRVMQLIRLRSSISRITVQMLHPIEGSGGDFAIADDIYKMDAIGVISDAHRLFQSMS